MIKAALGGVGAEPPVPSSHPSEPPEGSEDAPIYWKQVMNAPRGRGEAEMSDTVFLRVRFSNFRQLAGGSCERRGVSDLWDVSGMLR